MDVTPVAGASWPGTPDPIRRTSEDPAPAAAATDGAAATAKAAEDAARAKDAQTRKPKAAEEPNKLSPDLEALVKAASPDSSLLKFNVEKADVLAKFQIDQATNHVVVTMYQRSTGEVLRQFPPRHVLDVMAALAGRGLAVDVST
ncbi:MAG: flagellar protein FlaG [Thermoleophilia bacterium]